MLYYCSAFKKTLGDCDVSSSWTLYLYPADLETQEVLRKSIFKPHFISIKEILKCGLSYFLGSSFSTFGTARCSFAFLKTKKKKF